MTWSRLRLRQTAHLRDLTDEVGFTTAHLIQPIFVGAQDEARRPVDGLGDNARLSPAEAVAQVGRDLDAGVRHFLLFPVPGQKHAHPSDFAFLQRAVEAVKGAHGTRLHLWIDLCLCAWTSHGHCAVLDDRRRLDVPLTLDALGRMAVAVADAGADGVAPSDMMDGRTAHLRKALDEAGHDRVPVMSYSTKFASRFYGPFRDAAGSSPGEGDRRHYQVDIRSRTDAIASSVRCANEGADLLMVKPGMTSIDLIAPIVRETGKLVGAYQVSGEYAGLVALADRGLGDLDEMLLETWQVFRRAGAGFIITYGARRARAMGMPA
jgi:porphobilinogen synthase